MVPLVIGFQAAQDLDRILDRRLVDVDLLEAADQRAILLEVIAIFLVRGRADAADVAAGERGLQQVGRVHGAAAGGAGADHGVDLVDEQDRAGQRLELGQHGLQPLLEIAAIARAGQQRAHVECEDGGVLEDFRHFVLDDAAGQALRDRGLADAGIADIKRVVLLPPAQDLDGAVDLHLAADQRVDLAVLGLLVEVDAVGVQRVVAALLPRLLAAVAVALFLVGALRAALFAAARRLGDAVADIVDRVEAGHVLLLQEIDGVGFALGEHRDQHVGAGYFLAARRLDMDGGALQHALK